MRFCDLMSFATTFRKRRGESSQASLQRRAKFSRYSNLDFVLDPLGPKIVKGRIPAYSKIPYSSGSSYRSTYQQLLHGLLISSCWFYCWRAISIVSRLRSFSFQLAMATSLDETYPLRGTLQTVQRDVRTTGMYTLRTSTSC